MAKQHPYWLVVAMLCCAFTLVPQQDTTKPGKQQHLLILRVTVYDQYGNRIENAHVHLTHPWTSRNWTLFTDKRGRVHMPLENNTQYSAVAEKKGFLHSTTRMIQTHSQTTVDTLPVMLILR